MTKTYHISDSAYAANLLSVQVEGAEGTICVLAGIGETIAQYTKDYAKQYPGVVLADPVRKTMSILDSRVVSKMVTRAEELKMNIIAICTYSQYSKAEIITAKKYAIDKWGSKYFWILAHSQGGYNWINIMDDALASEIDASVLVAPGPGSNAKIGTIIAKAKMSVWLITSNLDTKTAGDLGQVTENLHKAIIDAGGHSFMTLYDKTGVYNEHSILDYVLINPAQWPAQGNAATPKMDIYEFLLSNEKGQPAVSPMEEYKLPVEQSPVVIEPAPVVVEPKPVRARLAVVNGTAIRLPGLTDKVPSSVLNIDQVYKAKDSERCAGVTIEWTPEGNKFTLDIRDVNNYRQPAIVVGPYK